VSIARSDGARVLPEPLRLVLPRDRECLPVFAMICLRSSSVSPLAEELIEHLARVCAPSGSGLRRRAERDRARENRNPRPGRAARDTANAFTGELEGRQRRVLTDSRARGKLICRHAEIAAGCTGRPAPTHDSHVPGNDFRVGSELSPTFVTAGPVTTVACALKSLSGRQDLREREVLARCLRSPARLHRAVREIDEAEVGAWVGRCGGRQSSGRRESSRRSSGKADGHTGAT